MITSWGSTTATFGSETLTWGGSSSPIIPIVFSNILPWVGGSFGYWPTSSRKPVLIECTVDTTIYKKSRNVINKNVSIIIRNPHMIVNDTKAHIIIEHIHVL
jgi:hypothetical protein